MVVLGRVGNGALRGCVTRNMAISLPTVRRHRPINDALCATVPRRSAYVANSPLLERVCGHFFQIAKALTKN